MRVLITLSLFLFAQFAVAEYAIKAGTLYTMAGDTMTDAVVLVRNGKIERVGAANTRIPAGYEVFEAEVVTPGFIDMRSTVGISGAYNVTADQDHDETTGPNQAHLRAIDAYNPAELLVDFVNRYGVTTMQVGPGRANVIGGQAAIVKTHGETLEDVLVRAPSAMVINLGETPKSTYRDSNKAPSTRMATASIIREALAGARNYEQGRDQAKKDKKPFTRELNKEALLAVLSGDIPVMINADRADDIMTAQRIAAEFKLDLWLDGGTEAYLVPKQLAGSRTPVIVHPAMQRPNSLEKLNTSLENAALLEQAGVTIALQSGTEGYVPKTRILLFEAAIAHANGLGMVQTLEAMTMTPARLLKLDKRVGSIERGKDADMVLFDGNPFEYTTHVLAVFTAGKVSQRKVR